ncbi:MAG: cytochrome c biogenesis protein CcdA [Actinomycetota bacterium]
MLAAFAEALRATWQPCTLVLVLPPLAAVVLTRGRWAPLAGTVIGAVVGGWVFAANVVFLSGVRLQLTGVLVAVALGTLAAATFRAGPTWMRTPTLQGPSAGLVAFTAALWWRPCVGNELGTILSTAANGPLSSALPGMTAYMLGALTPIVLVGFALHALSPPQQAMRWIGGTAAVVGLGFAALLAADRHNEIVSTLTRWTL